MKKYLFIMLVCLLCSSSIAETTENKDWLTLYRENKALNKKIIKLQNMITSVEKRIGKCASDYFILKQKNKQLEINNNKLQQESFKEFFILREENKRLKESNNILQIIFDEYKKSKVLQDKWGNNKDYFITEETTPKKKISDIDFVITERKMLNDALVISVVTTQLDQAKVIAKHLIDINKSHYMVRVFLYQHKNDLALISYEWTKSQGMIKKFDQRCPPPKKEKNSDLLDYEVLFRVRQMNNKRVYGEVLVATFSQDTSAKLIEQIAYAICEQERLDDIVLYSTIDAYKANNSALYLKSYPDALRKGFLGSLKNNKFSNGKLLFP